MAELKPLHGPRGAINSIAELLVPLIYGDGCLATEIALSGPRYAVVDRTGAVFFSDYANGLIRRVDPVTGIVTAVAGGATSSPASGAACSSTSTTHSQDALGDGCLGTQVKLNHPTGLAFDPAGNLYFGDYGYADVRKLAATGGVITTTGAITMADGQPSTTYGYASNFGTTTVVAATGGYLDSPFGIAIDTNGYLYIPDESKDAIVVVNTNPTGTATIPITGVTIPPGTVAKIVGTVTGGGTVCPNSPASTNGCNYGLYVNDSVANSSLVDAPYAATVDTSGNVYFANEYEDNTAKITNTVTSSPALPIGTLENFAGEQGTLGKNLANTVRGVAGTFSMGASVGIAADTYAAANVYIPDETNGFVWRVDASGTMYVVAGGAATVCSAAIDTYGDGCSAKQATFGASETYGSNSTLGIFGASVDQYADLFVGDAKNNLIREIASGTQFGNVGASQTDTVEIHFAANDGPASSGAYAITTGGTIFSLGTANCVTNADNNSNVGNTTDCTLPITAAPTTTGSFTGTLQVTSKLGATATFPLNGNFVESPVTRTVVSTSGAVGCTGTIYSPTTPVTLIANITANGPSGPTGTIVFYSNGTAIGTPVAVTNLGTISAPVYGATMSYTFATAGSDSITATYMPTINSYFTGSTSTAAAITIATPTFTTSAVTYQQNTVSPGQTALYSFNISQTAYTGTISFACSGLPANSSCSFSPVTISATGCTITNTVALSILTQQEVTVQPAGFGGAGHGPWQMLSVLCGLGLALIIGLRRRRIPMRYGQLWMALALLLAVSGTIACGKAPGTQITPATPAFNGNVTITATGSAGTTTSFTVPLIVN